MNLIDKTQVETQDLKSNYTDGCQTLKEIQDSNQGLGASSTLNISDVQNMKDSDELFWETEIKYKSTTCSDELLDVSDLGSLNQQSVCPWEYVMNSNKDR